MKFITKRCIYCSFSRTLNNFKGVSGPINLNCSKIDVVFLKDV